MSVFCKHTGDLGLKVLGEVRLAMRARVSKIVRPPVKPAVFPRTSFAIAGDSAKEQHQLAMCRRWDCISRTCGSAIVTGTRIQGSRGFATARSGLGG